MERLTATVRVAVHALVVSVLLASMATHAATYVGADFRRHAPGVKWLPLVGVAAFIAALTALTLNQYDGQTGDFTRRGEWAFAGSLVLFAVIVLYTQYVWASWDGSTLDHVVERPDGTLYLSKFRSREVVRELTEYDARWYEARRLRCLSCGWVLFSAIAAGLLGSRWLPRESSPDAEPNAAADGGIG